MNDLDAPTERSPYWGKCEEMSPAQLGRFIEHALRRLSGPAALDPEDLPTSEEEFVALCGLLDAKTDALKQVAPPPMPPRPTYDGPPSPGWFAPSEDLTEALRIRNIRLERLEDALRYGERENYVERARRELRAAERKIPPLEEVERDRRREHATRRREYEEAWTAHRRRVRLWEARATQERKRLEAETGREKAVERIRREVKRAFEPEDTSGPEHIGTLPFEIAAPGEKTDNDAVYRYYRDVLGRGKLKGFDQERLDKMLALPRIDWKKGRTGFDGYIVLIFAHTEKVLLECPVYGNAIYVLNSGEERLLKLRKPQLIASDEAKRIFHTGDWYQKVKRALEIE